MIIEKTVHGDKGSLVQITYHKETGYFERAVINLVPGWQGVLLTFDWKETKVFLRICKLVFEKPEQYEKQGLPYNFLSDTDFRYMAPLVGMPDTFWYSYGDLNCFVPREQVLQAYTDLKKALKALKGILQHSKVAA